MTTQVCRDIIGVISRYVHPMKAQYLLEHYCDIKELTVNNFSVNDLPKFILYLARQRDSIETVNDNQFYSMMSNLVSLSNHDYRDPCEHETNIQLTNGELN